jgi:hypothetical protein
VETRRIFQLVKPLTAVLRPRNSPTPPSVLLRYDSRSM